MKNPFYKKVIKELIEGIVIMDEVRKIIYINQKAKEITGWKMGERVPYCSYCQLREVSGNEDRCILANDNPLPSFRSHIPNYVDNEADFEMSMNKLAWNGENFQVLIIRNPAVTSQDKKVKTQELLIHEIMLAQEGERKRIARELHDHIGQSIYSIFLGLEGMKRHIDNDEFHERFEKINAVMEDTLQSLKQLTKELRPQLFDNLGLESAIKSLVGDWRQLYKIDFTLSIQLPNELKFKNDEGLHLYRIIQEAVTNAIRHGKATDIKIEIDKRNNELYFQITDNGVGFDLQTMNRNGLGLRHMKERVKMLNGDVKWISEKGGPTRVEGYITV